MFEKSIKKTQRIVLRNSYCSCSKYLKCYQKLVKIYLYFLCNDENIYVGVVYKR